MGTVGAFSGESCFSLMSFHNKSLTEKLIKRIFFSTSHTVLSTLSQVGVLGGIGSIQASHFSPRVQKQLCDVMPSVSQRGKAPATLWPQTGRWMDRWRLIYLLIGSISKYRSCCSSIMLWCCEHRNTLVTQLVSLAYANKNWPLVM